MPATDDDLPYPAQRPSRSQVKRDHQALQAMAEALARLPRDELLRLGLGEATWAALDETARIKDQRALRRHYRRIASCLARENQAPIAELLRRHEQAQRGAAARHRRIERWRARLVGEGDAALAELIVAYPDLDRQRVRAVLRSARRDAGQGRPEGPRRLFRLLREVIDGA